MAPLNLHIYTQRGLKKLKLFAIAHPIGNSQLAYIYINDLNIYLQITWIYIYKQLKYIYINDLNIYI